MNYVQTSEGELISPHPVDSSVENFCNPREYLLRSAILGNTSREVQSSGIPFAKCNPREYLLQSAILGNTSCEVQSSGIPLVKSNLGIILIQSRTPRTYFVYFFLYCYNQNKMAGEIIFPWVKASTGTSIPIKWTIQNSHYEIHSPELESFELSDLLPHILEVRKK